MKRIYLDYAATTPTDSRVEEAMSPYYSEKFGNASSVHGYGREAKEALENSRAKLASCIGARESEFVFTSGGTESDNSALFAIAAKSFSSSRRHLIISSIEHHAIFHTAEALRNFGFSVSTLAVDQNGFLSPDELRQAITKETFLVSVIHVNNEIGVIQNISELVSVAHESGIPFHTDAVQSFCKTEFDILKSDVDLASFAAHKIHGPKGIGGLFIKRGIDFDPLLHGGSQERNRRPGTESIPLVVGFARAAELCVQDYKSENVLLSKLNSILRSKIAESIPGAIFNSPEEHSVPNILSVSIDSNVMEIDGEAMIINMDLEGIAIASGSACSSGSLQPSHVIKALGRDDKTTMATARFSFGRFTTEEEVSVAAETFAGIVSKIGKRKKLSLPVS